jgi:hypothetical protein
MILSELWRLYETDKRIQGFSPKNMESIRPPPQNADEGTR